MNLAFVPPDTYARPRPFPMHPQPPPFPMVPALPPYHRHGNHYFRHPDRPRAPFVHPEHRAGGISDEEDANRAIEVAARREQLRDIRPNLDRLPVLGVDCIFPKVSSDFYKVLKEAHNSFRDLDLARVSLFLRTPIHDDHVPGDLRKRIVIAGTDARGERSVILAEQSCDFLVRAFQLPADLINRVLTDARMLLTDAIEILYKDGHALAHGEPSEPLRVTDAVVAVCLSALWEKEERARERSAAESRERKRYETARANGELFDCPCCCEGVIFEDLVQCPAGHLFCRACVRRQVETATGEGRADVPCLAIGECGHSISHAELERSLPASVVRRLIQTEALNAITGADIPGLVSCRGCGAVWVFDGEESVVTCRECRAKTCRLCGRAPHEGHTCEEVAAIDGDRLVEARVSAEVVRTCPHCRTQFVKDEGCNRMECPRCKTFSCYFCRCEIPREIGYAHFWNSPEPCPPGKCPLWVSNEALREIEAEAARRE